MAVKRRTSIESYPMAGEEEVPRTYCIFCQEIAGSTVVSGTLRIACKNCGAKSYVTRLPRQYKLDDFVPRSAIP